MRRLYIVSGMIIAAILLVALVGFLQKTQDVSGALDMSDATDLIGTKVGTTTRGVGFGNATPTSGQSATSTYPFFIGGAAENVAITLKSTGVASSTGNLQIEILASNDTSCNTATTTTIYDVVTRKQINWFDANLFIKNGAAVTGFNSGTSTIVWTNPKQSAGRIIELVDVNANCLALRVSGSSTEVWAQYKFRGQY